MENVIVNLIILGFISLGFYKLFEKGYGLAVILGLCTVGIGITTIEQNTSKFVYKIFCSNLGVAYFLGMIYLVPKFLYDKIIQNSPSLKNKYSILIPGYFFIMASMAVLLTALPFPADMKHVVRDLFHNTSDYDF